jgi:hypothetical protein
MKKIRIAQIVLVFIMILAIIILLKVNAWPADISCSDCTKDNPCAYFSPAGDGCNTCSSSTWCENEKWFTDGIGSCTLKLCTQKFEIENPFKEKGKNNEKDILCDGIRCMGYQFN